MKEALRWQHSALAEAVEAAAADVGVVEVVEVVRETVKVVKGVVEHKTASGEVKEVVKIVGVAVKVAADQAIPGTRLSGMLTYLPLRPATGTGPSGSRRTSAWSRPPVHGRISLHQDQIIEKLTSSITEINIKK